MPLSEENCSTGNSPKEKSPHTVSSPLKISRNNAIEIVPACKLSSQKESKTYKNNSAFQLRKILGTTFPLENYPRSLPRYGKFSP